MFNRDIERERWQLVLKYNNFQQLSLFLIFQLFFFSLSLSSSVYFKKISRIYGVWRVSSLVSFFHNIAICTLRVAKSNLQGT